MHLNDFEISKLSKNTSNCIRRGKYSQASSSQTSSVCPTFYCIFERILGKHLTYFKTKIIFGRSLEQGNILNGLCLYPKVGVGDLWVDSCRHSKSEISINHKKFIYMYDSIVIEPKEGPYFYQCK